MVGISGIDASGKGFVTQASRGFVRQEDWRISDPGNNLAVIGADGWLNLPHVRFNQENPAKHFYDKLFASTRCLKRSILPLRQNREIDLGMDYTEETANDYRPHRYQFREIDIVLVEGIFLLQARYATSFRSDLLGGLFV